MITLGSWLRDVISQNPETFRLFGPDETASNRLQDVYEVTDKVWQYRIEDSTSTLPAPDGSWRSSANTCARAGWRGTC